ncbi:hypothetical protein EON65_44975 [archaeon]|nr:MAG: hypothetical protein EON65_44975 [archaeon]
MISPLVDVINNLKKANDLSVQKEALPKYLQPILKKSIPRLDQTSSVAFIASELWFGNKHQQLADRVNEKCFHVDPQSRRIIGVVQAYGCGKTKTSLRLSDSYILLPVRFNLSTMGQLTLTDCMVAEQKQLLRELGSSPTFEEVQLFSIRCRRLVTLCLFTLVELYDACLQEETINDIPEDRFLFALLLLHDRQELVDWCKTYFETYKKAVSDDNAFEQLRLRIMGVKRHHGVVFLFDEVHILFNQCRGFVLHELNVGGDYPHEVLVLVIQIHCTNRLFYSIYSTISTF